MGTISTNSLDIKVRIANLYYRENLSQQEIAKLLNISRTTVSRILKNCIDEGIVSIHIKNTSVYQYELENRLQQKYGLKHVCVVSAQSDTDTLLKTIGEATSAFLQKAVTQNTRIGVSAGTTIQAVIQHLRSISGHSIDVFQMCGDASHQISNCSSVLTMELARALNGTPHAMHVPLLVHTKVLRDLLLEEPFNKKHFQQLENLDVALVGLGLLDALLPDTSDTWYSFFADKEELQRKKAVGDICGNFIDINGNLCNADIQDRTIAIPLKHFKKIPYCIAVAYGKNKLKIAKSALAGHYINVLITDEPLAYALLEEE